MPTLRNSLSAALRLSSRAHQPKWARERRNLIEPTGPTAPPGPTGGRLAVVDRFLSRQLEVTDPFATFTPPAAPTGG